MNVDLGADMGFAQLCAYMVQVDTVRSRTFVPSLKKHEILIIYMQTFEWICFISTRDVLRNMPFLKRGRNGLFLLLSSNFGFYQRGIYNKWK